MSWARAATFVAPIFFMTFATVSYVTPFALTMYPEEEKMFSLPGAP